MRIKTKKLLKVLLIVVCIILLYKFCIPNDAKLIVLKEKQLGNIIKQYENECRIPQIPEVDDIYFDGKRLKCQEKKLWVVVEKGKIQIDPSVENIHGKVICNLTYFTWKNHNEVKWSTKIVSFPFGSSLESDYFHVVCQSKDGSLYSNLHAAIAPSKSTKDAIESKSKPENWSGLNVYIFAFDSLSRKGAFKKLPKTMSYLQKTLETAVLEGYNAISDYREALISIFTQMTKEDHSATRQVNDVKNTDYQWIWNKFSEAGYVTMLAEDKTKFYFFQGLFQRQPTTHCMRTFYLAAEPFYLAAYHSESCLGTEPDYVRMFHQTEQLFDAYPDQIPLFDLSIHHGDVIDKTVDDEMLKHLEWMEKEGHLNNTLFVLMSTHGLRSKSQQEPSDGPLITLTLPKWFREDQGNIAWQNIQQNVKALTTPLDLHNTLLDVIHWETLPAMGDISKPSVSLWKKIPKSRTCAQALIEPQWCPCLKWQNIPYHPDLVLYAENVIEAINKETKRQRNLCIKLHLKSIVSGKKLVAYENVVANTELSYSFYMIKFYTTPGNALYEAVVEYEMELNEVIVDFASIFHVNRNKDEVHCVVGVDYDLIKWCICNDHLW